MLKGTRKPGSKARIPPYQRQCYGHNIEPDCAQHNPEFLTILDPGMHRLQSSQGLLQKHTLYLVGYVPEQRLHETGIHGGDHRSPFLCRSTKGEIPRIPRRTSPRTALCAEGREHFGRLRTPALWAGGWHDQLRSQGQTLERRPTFFTGVFKNRHTPFLSRYPEPFHSAPVSVPSGRAHYRVNLD